MALNHAHFPEPPNEEGHYNASVQQSRGHFQQQQFVQQGLNYCTQLDNAVPAKTMS
ncbi:hypothetical protein XMA121_000697 [Marinobacterium sp. xm-a-121]|nr:hypothetical protein [Marinobacterium sp. xm-g-48]NRP28163.1 hypothetical protein [Marinobacterium sp. xm-d-420]NRP38093.1 hypothetical protein [Marinobacterium sp. xm-a-121]NRP48145.1 hypothetical protein [Marinobacterium sp. xm-d-543]NRP57634.1 hypothetical protein [Marinobacterium sp. xm-d-510]NRP84003.1 hypothetical protein [Marinobacterium sp. xm-d-509]NRP98146.1 hypothetical protein [Marinobacterium sp. xm-a-127]NRP98891.1 hypothetical protein [Marinobacterium sp. xm-v-233]NRQ24496